MTGRKIIIDTYGGYGRHGGGAFSGKDPTKVDRSGAYAARYVAKNIVAPVLLRSVKLQMHMQSVLHVLYLSWLKHSELLPIPMTNWPEAVNQVFDLRPTSIIETLELRKPIYRNLAAYGHMGREDLNVSWEKADKVEALKNALK